MKPIALTSDPGFQKRIDFKRVEGAKMTLTEQQCQLLAKTLKWQAAAPARATVNSEAAFVKYKLEVLGEVALAKQYWSWVCSGANPGYFPAEIDTLQSELKKIDQGAQMPAWGTYGT
jgi:hypothetical protein